MTTKKQRPTSKPFILETAVRLAKERGLRKFSRNDLAKETGLASATVTYHFGGMAGLLREVVKFATENEVLSILADVRADRERSNLGARMTPQLKKKVAHYVANN